MKNERIPPVIFAECGCRLDLIDNKKMECTPCKFHTKVIVDRTMKSLIFGDPDIETGI